MVAKQRLLNSTRVSKVWLSVLWQVAVVILIGIFVWKQRHEVAEAIRVVRTAHRSWLVALVIGAFMLQASMSGALAAVIRVLGFPVPFPQAFMVRAEREMVATVMPFGGIASFVVLVQRFGRYGVTNNDAGIATMLYTIVGHLSFLMVVIPTIAWMVITHGATAAVWFGIGIILLSVGTVGALLVALLQGKRLPASINRYVPEAARSFQSHAGQIDIHGKVMILPIVISLLGDLTGVLCVWLALHAVGEPSSIMIAASAYTVGTLMMLAVPVFQGIGFVEVSMTVTMQQLGISVPHALAATLLYRIVEIWLPVIIGIAVQVQYRPKLRGLPAHLPALWTGFNGIVMMILALPHRIHWHERRLTTTNGSRTSAFYLIGPEHLSHTVSLIGGFLLVILALRLIHRQRSAWLVALGLSVVLTINHVLLPHDHLAALLTGTNVIVLLLYRDRFRLRSDIASVRTGFIMLLSALVVTYLYVVASLWIADEFLFGIEFSIRSSLRTALDVLTGNSDGGLTPHSRAGEWTLDSFHLLMLLALAVPVIAILRPIVWRRLPNDSDMTRARVFISEHGNSSLDRFKYWPDKFQFFASQDTGVVSYGVHGQVALALGDPTLATPDAFDSVLSEFTEFCSVNNVTPAFHQVSSTHLQAYRNQGFVTISVGQDAIVHVKDFTLSGHAMKSLRTTHNKALRTGITITAHQPPHDASLLAELREISDGWLTLDGRRERTFTLGQFDEHYLQECPILVLRSAEGRAEAFINLIPDGVPGEVTFDLMRHRVDAPNGAMDSLLLGLIDYARDNGMQTVSLGMVPFAGVGKDEQVDTLNRALGMLSTPMGHFFASESLFNYKNKFHPTWEPRYLVVPNIAVLPKIAMALVELTELKENRQGWLRHIHLPQFEKRAHP